MKNNLAIKVIISGLVITNIGTAGLLVKQTGWLAKLHAWHKPAQEKESKASRTAVLRPATFKNSSELQVCYESLLQREPQVDEGSVEVHWRVDENGQVDFLKLIHSDWSDEDFTGCVLNKIKDARFSEENAHSGALVAHTFRFHRRSPAHLEYE